MHRPRVTRNRFVGRWQVACADCKASDRLWLHRFDSWRMAYRYAQEHAIMSATYGSYASPARWFEWGGV